MLGQFVAYKKIFKPVSVSPSTPSTLHILFDFGYFYLVLVVSSFLFLFSIGAHLSLSSMLGRSTFVSVVYLMNFIYCRFYQKGLQIGSIDNREPKTTYLELKEIAMASIHQSGVLSLLIVAIALIKHVIFSG